MALTARVTSLDLKLELIVAKCRSPRMAFGLFESAERRSTRRACKNSRDHAGTGIFYPVKPAFEGPDSSDSL